MEQVRATNDRFQETPRGGGRPRCLQKLGETTRATDKRQLPAMVALKPCNRASQPECLHTRPPLRDHDATIAHLDGTLHNYPDELKLVSSQCILDVLQLGPSLAMGLGVRGIG